MGPRSFMVCTFCPTIWHWFSLYKINLPPFEINWFQENWRYTLSWFRTREKQRCLQMPRSLNNKIIELIAPCKGMQDSLGFLDSTPWTSDSRYWIPASMEVGFRIPVVIWYSRFFKLCSGFHTWGFRIRIPLHGVRTEFYFNAVKMW